MPLPDQSGERGERPHGKHQQQARADKSEYGGSALDPGARGGPGAVAHRDQTGNRAKAEAQHSQCAPKGSKRARGDGQGRVDERTRQEPERDAHGKPAAATACEHQSHAAAA